MAINDERDVRLTKASSLENDALSEISSKSDKKTGVRHNADGRSNQKRAFRRGVVADLILLLVLVGLGMGAWLGYHAVRDMYAPVWEERSIELCVRITDIDYERADQLLSGLTDHSLWHTDAVDGTEIGRVTDVRAVPSTVNGREIMTLYLTVEVTAQYRNSQGYFVGDVRLLAGATDLYRANGLVAEGTVVSLNDPMVETEAQETEAQEVAG